jgi:crotonobetainyl-CoA:carnitine CoA-transferase CaiB-like acyl-CoA transferase
MVAFLSGIKVVEFSHMVMGPTIGVILGDLGADVIKVEPMDGDKTRNLLGSGAGYFAMYNRNKRSIRANLKSRAGHDAVMRIISGADVVIENFRAGALDKLGLGYEDCRKVNSKIIYQSAKGFLEGPYKNRAALDEVAQMMGGLAYMTGPVGRPLRAGASVIDVTGGMFGVIGILGAIIDRDKGGQGAHLTTALYETTAFLVGQHIAQYAVTGKPAAPMPERISAWAVYDVFQTADEQVFVGVVSDGQWVKFCREFGFDAWANDDSLASNRDRVLRRDDILPAIRAQFSTMSAADLLARLESAGMPFAPIRRPEDMIDDPHLAANGFYDLTLPGGDTEVTLPKLPVSVDGERLALHRGIPESGADTEAVMREVGMSDQEIADLKKAGAIS